jgi:hypothetical protein
VQILPTKFNLFGEEFSMTVKNQFKVNFFADMMLVFEIQISLNSCFLSTVNWGGFAQGGVKLHMLLFVIFMFKRKTSRYTFNKNIGRNAGYLYISIPCKHQF